VRIITFGQLGPEKGIHYARQHLRVKIASGEFPAPIALSSARIGWREKDIDNWLEKRPSRNYAALPPSLVQRHRAAQRSRMNRPRGPARK
jgi:Prophage CP4-57 regulatory protein (AlpA)